MDLPQRKKVRMNGYDYSQNGGYFITICTKDHVQILGKIVGGGVPDAPQSQTQRNTHSMQLSDYGKIIDDVLAKMIIFYENISLPCFVIMPNHIHFILVIESHEGGTSRTPSPTLENAAVPSFISTFKRFTNKKIGFNIWQRSYHDRIIRNEQEYFKIWEYIHSNPSRWQDDCFYAQSISSPTQ